MNALASTQREFFHALLEPLSGRSRASTDLSSSSDRLSPRFEKTARALLRATPNLNAVERLELYHRQYWFRLLESIEEDFPYLKIHLGPDRFWRLIEDYLLSHPSNSYTLRHLGSRLPGFVEKWHGISMEESPWATALASIEWAMMDVLDSPNSDIPTPDDFLAHLIGLQDHLRYLMLPVPAHLLCTDAPPAWPDLTPEPTLVVVWRPPAHGPRLIAEDTDALPLLHALHRGGRLESILASLEHPPTPDRISGWFQRWQVRGWFARHAPPGSQPRRVGSAPRTTEKIAFPVNPQRLPHDSSLPE